MPTITTCTVHAECVVVDGVEHRHAYPRAPDAPLVKDVEKAERAAIARLKEAGEKAHRIRFELAPLLEDVEKRVREAEARVRGIYTEAREHAQDTLQTTRKQAAALQEQTMAFVRDTVATISRAARDAGPALVDAERRVREADAKVRDITAGSRAAGQRAIAEATRQADELKGQITKGILEASDAIKVVARAETRRLITAQTEFTRQMTAAQTAITTTTTDAVKAAADARKEMAAEYASFATAVDEERVRLATARHAFTEKAERASADLREEAKEVVRAAHEELKELAKTKEALERGVRDLMRSAQAVTA